MTGLIVKQFARFANFIHSNKQIFLTVYNLVRFPFNHISFEIKLVKKLSLLSYWFDEKKCEYQQLKVISGFSTQLFFGLSNFHEKAKGHYLHFMSRVSNDYKEEIYNEDCSLKQYFLYPKMSIFWVSKK